MGSSKLDSYFDPNEPGSYAGATTYRRHHKNIKYNELADILSGYRGFTLHAPARVRFPRNKTIVGGIDAQWEVDLADMQRFADKNNGFKYWLCAVDVLSKKAWVQPIRSKKAPEVHQAFEKIFAKTNRKPLTVRTDKGGEFNNKALKKFFQKYKIKYFTSENEEIHASIAERFIRTIKGRVFRYFTHNRTDRYIDVLDKLVESYNKTYHRSIGMPPNEVNDDNEVKIWHRLYGGLQLTNYNFKFSVGDHVRIQEHRATFRKGYEGAWTEEIFKIVKRLPRHPPVYRIVDYDNEPITGTFYENELQKVKMLDDIFIVDKVLKQRRRNGKTEYFVSWLGYPKKFNSWTTNLL